MKVGFVAEHPDAGVIGGAERATATLTEALANRGVEVHYFSYVVPTHPRANMNFHKVKFPLNPTSRNLRKNVIPTRLMTLVSKPLEMARRNAYLKSLAKENCDVYVQVCAGQPTGHVAHYCHDVGVPFIFRSTSLWDADLTFQGWNGFRESTRKLYLYGLENTDKIVPNSKQTAEAFKKHRELTGKTFFIPDGFAMPDRLHVEPGSYVLWVGRSAPYKQPWLFVELAERLPQQKFVMVGDIPDRSNPPGNLRYTGRIDELEELAAVYRGAGLIVNTSVVEGFPNVLVEAGMHCKPYVGFFDPDGVVEEFDLGFQAKDFDDLVCKVDYLMKNDDVRKEKGWNARKYMEENRDITKTVFQWITLFKELM